MRRAWDNFHGFLLSQRKITPQGGRHLWGRVWATDNTERGGFSLSDWWSAGRCCPCVWAPTVWRWTRMVQVKILLQRGVWMEHICVSQLNQQRLWRLLQLSRPRYLIPVLTRGLAKAGKQNQAATQRLTSLKEQQGTEIQAGVWPSHLRQSRRANALQQKCETS